ncbi:hypothetical protein J2T22_001652 [Pseudarthrobacter defluvii]|uniref:Uncharacterized protein n=1 Tax=Pseudarthrobacter defluvii TaxID=410837 RepID=A0ABT9UFP9_9MICC|nr:hypothetical protein [Pseudarthrobacter defluvii]MDQ0118474.1 hypothetical protein [Pseudarthrobacter defluvii]
MKALKFITALLGCLVLGTQLMADGRSTIRAYEAQVVNAAQPLDQIAGSATLVHTVHADLALHQTLPHICCGGRSDPTHNDYDGSRDITVTWQSDPDAKWEGSPGIGGPIRIAAHATVTRNYNEHDKTVHEGWGGCENGQTLPVKETDDIQATGSDSSTEEGYIVARTIDNRLYVQLTHHDIPSNEVNPPATYKQTTHGEGPGYCGNPPPDQTRTGVGGGNLFGTAPQGTMPENCLLYEYISYSTPVNSQGSCTFSGSTQPPESSSQSDTYNWRVYICPQVPSPGESCQPPHHFVVDLKSWIPMKDVVDPVLPNTVDYPSSVDYEAFDANCYGGQLSFIDQLNTFVTSAYLGDAHAVFTGTYRSELIVSFDFDGKKIQNFDVAKNGGVSVRHKVYTTNRSGSPPVVHTCEDSEQDTLEGQAKQSGDASFVASYKASNPLIPLHLAPAFVQRVTAGFEGADTLKVSYTVTDFPSAGIEISRDGTKIVTALSNDASCIPYDSMHGLSGAIKLLIGLNRFSEGSFTASAKSPHTEGKASPLC